MSEPEYGQVVVEWSDDTRQWLVVMIGRAKRTKRVYLSPDQAARLWPQLRAKLEEGLGPVP
jgi:hypothetical protein